ncbi:M48 family metalloprotease [Sphingomonas sp. BN140010]|uniref:M48 family metalloprotease n=1 Tax=Sphingomonas arvum TaxID=2992113 RepID=A0ABT3JDU1_9SPHN|nr:M48 family metallopeptidase [Sphingomonas sp. BN140010]MCW3797247.1 M48 family metalloprotease [Sphingomonas sp. BN140010]
MTGDLSRRALLVGSGATAAMLASGAGARILPSSLQPLIGPGYRPTDRDELGMWQQMQRVEEEIAGSNLLIKDEGVNRYLQSLIGKVGGPAAKDMRIYLARIPEFNAVMFPTGFAVVFSGLLLRMRDEAQLAGVLAHESSHFLLKHQIRQWRDTKRRTDVLSFTTMLGGMAGGAAGVYTGDLAQLAQLGTILTLLRYNRQLEAEADALGIKLIAGSGYEPLSMSQTWEQLIGEIELSARVRRKRPDRGYSIFSTHPAPRERMIDLRQSAAELTVPGRPYDRGRERYLQAIGRVRPTLFDDQVKLNDAGATRYIIETLAKDGWNGQLRFYEGESLRLQNADAIQDRAALSYAAAVAYPDAPADAWRWHGIYLLKSGRRDEGRAALQRYLTLAPSAPDAPFVRQMLVS